MKSGCQTGSRTPWRSCVLKKSENALRKGSGTLREHRTGARQPARIGDIGLNGTLPITMAEALALRKPEFESSDEEAEKK